MSTDTSTIPVSTDFAALLALADPEWVRQAKAFMDKHELRPEPAATMEDIVAWERCYETRLPTEYVHFLLAIGNGLWEVDNSPWKREDEILCGIPSPAELAAKEPEVVAAEASALRQLFTAEGEMGAGFDEQDFEKGEVDEIELTEEELAGCDGSDEDIFMLKRDKALQSFADEAGDVDVAAQQGTLLIGEYGGAKFLLVVTGPQRGQVWKYENKEGHGASGAVEFSPEGSFGEWLARGGYFD